ncbi:DEAD/DEAH box helicase [Patescibacteria group bacterium]|nr:DEAD/DEAH box helicase [Patescibacteria group bacterium]MBU1891107.1 DEAD/DEAH box helicase [Patescibacteria group bacterium]
MSQKTTSNFYGLGIAPKLLEILEKNHFTTPTPIQAKTIPLAIEGKDLIGIAQTGTGKTLAFGIPMMQNIARLKTRGLVLVPTRELASQVEEMLMRFGRSLGLRTAVVVGGASMHLQIRALNSRPHIIVATPGRLIDHLSKRQALLNDIGILTLDEADRMLDMGFAPQIEKILIRMPKKRQTLLFSATMPQSIVAIASQHMHLPLRVEIAQPGTTVKEVDQEVIFLPASEKRTMLKKVLNKYSGSILIFSRTKWGANKLSSAIRAMGYTATEIHSNRSLPQRRLAIEGFKKGTYQILVATDIAARGIDVNNIEVVINFDLPGTPDDYVHRIGRTARAGKKGKAISFATPDQQRDVRDIEHLIRTQIVIGEGSALPKTSQHVARNSQQQNYNYRSRPRRRRRRN